MRDNWKAHLVPIITDEQVKLSVNFRARPHMGSKLSRSLVSRRVQPPTSTWSWMANVNSFKGFRLMKALVNKLFYGGCASPPRTCCRDQAWFANLGQKVDSGRSVGRSLADRFLSDYKNEKKYTYILIVVMLLKIAI